ncbi:class I SAM-dependent methyltransferase [Ferruginibacter sp.]
MLKNFSNYWETKHRDAEYFHEELSPLVKEEIINLNLSASSCVLDHGCGQGRVSFFIAKFTNHIYLNDISSTAIKKTLATFKSEFSNINPVAFTGMLYEANFKKQFDLIISHRVLHCMTKEERIKTYKFYYDSLKKGGKILLSVKSINCKKYDQICTSKNYHLDNTEKGSFFSSNPFRFLQFFDIDLIANELHIQNLLITKHFEFFEKSGNKKSITSNLGNLYLFCLVAKK